MSGSPLVSICIPAYNGESYIRQCLESVFSQSYSNLELIISDDSSTDETAEIIETTLQAIKSVIPVIFRRQKNNLGLERNWNFVLSLATGKYIKILPSDDYILPNCIHEQVNAFQLFDDTLTLVFCARNIVTHSDKHVTSVRFYKNQQASGYDLIRKSFIHGTNIIGEPGAVLFRKDHADRIGEFNGTHSYVIDIDYWSRLLKFGDGYGIATPLCVFRIGSNLSVKLGISRVSDYWAFINESTRQWKVSKTVSVYGKLRSGLNEMLRRVFHIYCRIIS